jgi:hypothetical protein
VIVMCICEFSVVIKSLKLSKTTSTKETCKLVLCILYCRLLAFVGAMDAQEQEAIRLEISETDLKFRFNELVLQNIIDVETWRTQKIRTPGATAAYIAKINKEADDVLAELRDPDTGVAFEDKLIGYTVLCTDRIKKVYPFSISSQISPADLHNPFMEHVDGKRALLDRLFIGSPKPPPVQPNDGLVDRAGRVGNHAFCIYTGIDINRLGQFIRDNRSPILDQLPVSEMPKYTKYTSGPVINVSGDGLCLGHALRLSLQLQYPHLFDAFFARIGSTEDFFHRALDAHFSQDNFHIFKNIANVVRSVDMSEVKKAMFLREKFMAKPITDIAGDRLLGDLMVSFFARYYNISIQCFDFITEKGFIKAAFTTQPFERDEYRMFGSYADTLGKERDAFLEMTRQVVVMVVKYDAHFMAVNTFETDKCRIRGLRQVININDVIVKMHLRSFTDNERTEMLGGVGHYDDARSSARKVDDRNSKSLQRSEQPIKYVGSSTTTKSTAPWPEAASKRRVQPEERLSPRDSKKSSQGKSFLFSAEKETDPDEQAYFESCRHQSHALANNDVYAETCSMYRTYFTKPKNAYITAALGEDVKGTFFYTVSENRIDFFQDPTTDGEEPFHTNVKKVYGPIEGDVDDATFTDTQVAISVMGEGLGIVVFIQARDGTVYRLLPQKSRDQKMPLQGKFLYQPDDPDERGVGIVSSRGAWITAVNRPNGSSYVLFRGTPNPTTGKESLQKIEISPPETQLRRVESIKLFGRYLVVHLSERNKNVFIVYSFTFGTKRDSFTKVEQVIGSFDMQSTGLFDSTPADYTAARTHANSNGDHGAALFLVVRLASANCITFAQFGNKVRQGRNAPLVYMDMARSVDPLTGECPAKRDVQSDNYNGKGSRIHMRLFNADKYKVNFCFVTTVGSICCVDTVHATIDGPDITDPRIVNVTRIPIGNEYRFPPMQIHITINAIALVFANGCMQIRYTEPADDTNVKKTARKEEIDHVLLAAHGAFGYNLETEGKYDEVVSNPEVTMQHKSIMHDVCKALMYL